MFADESVINDYAMLELCSCKENVIIEMCSYMESLSENLTPEIEDIIESEICEGNYLDNLSLNEVRTKFDEFVVKIGEDDCPNILDAIDIYVNIADKVMKKY